MAWHVYHNSNEGVPMNENLFKSRRQPASAAAAAAVAEEVVAAAASSTAAAIAHQTSPRVSAASSGPKEATSSSRDTTVESGWRNVHLFLYPSPSRGQMPRLLPPSLSTPTSLCSSVLPALPFIVPFVPPFLVSSAPPILPHPLRTVPSRSFPFCPVPPHSAPSPSVPYRTISHILPSTIPPHSATISTRSVLSLYRTGRSLYRTLLFRTVPNPFPSPPPPAQTNNPPPYDP